MTVASDTSVASIYRPTSGPRTPADTDKKEGAGSFGMMLDQTNQADAPAPRADRTPARSNRRDDTRPAADRRPDAPRAKESRPAKDTKAAEQADRSQDSKSSDDVKETKDTTDNQTAGQAGKSNEQPKTQDAQASEQATEAAQTGQALETTMDAAVVQDGAAVATEATGEAVAAAETPTEDTASTTDTAEDSEKTDDIGTATVVVTVAADTTPIPVATIAVAADPTAPVSTEATPEGDAEAVATVNGANTQGAAPAAEAPNEATAPVVAEPVAKTEGKPGTKPEATSEAASETKPEAKSEAKPEGKAEAKPEAKADAKIEGGAPKHATNEAKPASDDKPESAIKLSTDDGAPKPDVKDAQHTKHSSEVNREIADGVSTKAADATLAAAKAGLESVQSLNASTAAQPAPPALHLNVTATAAAAGAATANNMASNAVPIDGVAVEIAAQSQNGKNSFEIRLDPKELGRIDVRLEVDKDGHVTAKMTVDRVETLDLLKRDASNIERTLQQAGLKTSDNSLEFSLRDQTFNNNNRNDDTRGNANTAQLVIPDDDGVSLEAVRSNYGRLLGLGRGLDIRI